MLSDRERIACDLMLKAESHSVRGSTIEEVITTARAGKSRADRMFLLYNREAIGEISGECLDHPIFETGKLKVAFLSPQWMVGGVERWFLALADHLQGVELAVVIPAISEIDQDMIDQLRRKAHFHVGSMPTSSAIQEADILLLWGVHAAKHAIRFQGPKVLLNHGPGEWTEKYTVTAAPHCTHFVAVSQLAADAWSVPDEKVAVIPNGIDLARCEPLKSRGATRAAWGLKPNEIAIGHVGRISQEKNPLAPALAASMLGSPYRSVYVGPAFGGESLVASIKMYDPRAIFIKPVEQVGDAYAALDCMIVGSEEEGFCLSAVEAMAAGLPLIATPTGILPEMSGFTPIPFSASPQILAEAVQIALGSETETAKQHARQYSAERMGAAWGSFLTGITCPV